MSKDNSKITIEANLKNITILYSYKTVYINFNAVDNLIMDNKLILKPKSLARIKYKFNSPSDLEPLCLAITKTKCKITINGSNFELAQAKDGFLINQFETDILECAL